MVSGHLPPMARNLVGLLLALLLCGGHAEGRDAERPRQAVSPRRFDQDAVDGTTPSSSDAPHPTDGRRSPLADASSPTDADADADADSDRIGDTTTGIPVDDEESTLHSQASSSWEDDEATLDESDTTEGVVVSSYTKQNRGETLDERDTVEGVGLSSFTSEQSKNVFNGSAAEVGVVTTNSSVEERDGGRVANVDDDQNTSTADKLLLNARLDSNSSSKLTASKDISVKVSENKDEVLTLNRIGVDVNATGDKVVTLNANRDRSVASNLNVDSVKVKARKGRRSPLKANDNRRLEVKVDGREGRITSSSGLRIVSSSETTEGGDLQTSSSSWTEGGEGVAFVAASTPRSAEAASWEARRRQRQATAAQEEAAEMVPACRKFVEGSPERQEFHSPNFPGNYPNNTDCVKVLAAEPGHLLRLDFRNEFHVEPSDGCRFDYLEVRDGAHGYENLIGTFCGKEFPPMMTSSGRHLWLRFHSDENIEYSGFTAVYESIPKPTTEMDTYELPDCVIEVGGSEGFLNTTSDIEPERRRIVAHYGLKLECMWIIRVKPGWRIQLSFLKFELSKPNDCVSNFVDVFSDRTDLPSRLKSFCGSIADMVTSKSHVLHVRFLAEAKAINSTFVALFTAFRDSKLSGSVCTQDEFDCQDETCISRHLRCNGRINCRFRWDEDECSTKISPMEKILRSDHIIIILVVFSLIMFGMCFAFVFNCVRKLMHDHKVIQENFRVSREGRLDEIGVKLPSPRAPSVASAASAANVVGSAECYVPGALLPVRVTTTPRDAARPSNGDAVFARRDATELTDDDDVDVDDDDDDAMIGFPAPEMRDSECQTRESLFHCQSDGSVTPPPPPPPPVMARHHHHHHHHPPQPPVGQFSTFGYTRDNRREDRVKEAATATLPTTRHAAAPATTPTSESARFRAEAVIEMEGRAFSVDSTKSAPDVIVTH